VLELIGARTELGFRLNYGGVILWSESIGTKFGRG